MLRDNEGNIRFITLANGEQVILRDLLSHSACMNNCTSDMRERGACICDRHNFELRRLYGKDIIMKKVILAKSDKKGKKENFFQKYFFWLMGW